HDELIRFQKRLKKYREYIFTFLYRPEVPPDNNASERAIRNIKVKQKVSGQFRSADGAFRFAVLRSITDTALKNGLNVLNSLKIIANLQTD
ncbi:MAG: transposase, partial [Bacteroidales bacterium]|nr:transposase [Bacteroidales bacterium]